MSLQVWLPLTKDLRQQGLSNVTVTNNGATFNSAGKLGGTYSATASGQTITIDFANLSTMLANGKTYTLTCWVKPTGTPSSGWVIKLGNNRCGLWWAKSEARWVWIENDNGKRCANPTISADYTNWHHLAIVVDKTVSGKITTQQYVDGVLAAGYPGSTWDCSSHSQPAGTVITISPYVSQLNDIRLYNHCLSPMEVKQLSQGLILHYPLNRQGWGQENLITNSKLDGSWTYPSSSYSDKYSPITTIVPSATQYTLSFDAKSTVNGDKMRTHYYSPNTTTTCVSSQGTTKTAADGHMDFTLTTQWERYWVTYTQTETTAVKHLICPRLVSGQGTGTVSVKNVKFEEGSIATPWCPNSADTLATTMGLNGTTEYDCSGFCNNLNNFANITYSSDTPKYSVSTFLSGSTYGSHNNFYSSDSYQNAMTVACWVKRTFSDATVRCIANSWVKLYIYTDFKLQLTWTMSTGSADITNTWASNQILPLNEWIHVCFTMQDGIVKCYINGILKNISNRTQYGTYIHGVRDNGFGGTSASAEQWIGGLSDFRFYATALSASDVKALYQNSAYIDNSGNVYGAVHSEV